MSRKRNGTEKRGVAGGDRREEERGSGRINRRKTSPDWSLSTSTPKLLLGAGFLFFLWFWGVAHADLLYLSSRYDSLPIPFRTAFSEFCDLNDPGSILKTGGRFFAALGHWPLADAVVLTLLQTTMVVLFWSILRTPHQKTDTTETLRTTEMTETPEIAESVKPVPIEFFRRPGPQNPQIPEVTGGGGGGSGKSPWHRYKRARKRSWRSAVGVGIPVFFLSAVIPYQGYYAFGCVQLSFFYALFFGAVAAFSVVLLVRRVQTPNVRLLAATLAVALFYPLFGFFALLAGILMAADERRKRGAGVWKRVGILAAATAIVPLAWSPFFAARLDLSEIFTVGVLPSYVDSPDPMTAGVTKFLVRTALAFFAFPALFAFLPLGTKFGRANHVCRFSWSFSAKTPIGQADSRSQPARVSKKRNVLGINRCHGDCPLPPPVPSESWGSFWPRQRKIAKGTGIKPPPAKSDAVFLNLRRGRPTAGDTLALAFLLPLAVLMTFLAAGDKGYDATLRSVRPVERGDWETILATEGKLDESPLPLIECRRLALFRTGRAAEVFFDRPNIGVVRQDLAIVTTFRIFGPELLFDYGTLNLASATAMNGFVQTENRSPLDAQILTLCAMANGENAAAEKYLRWLSRRIGLGGWVKSARRAFESLEKGTVSQDKMATALADRIRQARRLKPDGDWVDYNDKVTIAVCYASARRETSKLSLLEAEAQLLQLMQMADMKRFAELFPSYYQRLQKESPGARIPKAIQQGVIATEFFLRKSLDSPQYPCDPALVERFKAFLRATSRPGTLPPPEFADTWWYYFANISNNALY